MASCASTSSTRSRWSSSWTLDLATTSWSADARCRRGAASALGLPYRVVERCTGDVGSRRPRATTWRRGRPGWGSGWRSAPARTSRDFQARRDEPALPTASRCATQLVHTLNGSALGMPRTYAALLETHLQPDGSIRIPAVFSRISAPTPFAEATDARRKARSAGVGSSPARRARHDRAVHSSLGATRAGRRARPGTRASPRTAPGWWRTSSTC